MLHDTYSMFSDLWGLSRYCSSSNHCVPRDSQQFRLTSEDPSTLRVIALLKTTLRRDTCREDVLEVAEIEVTRSVASVSAVYQFLSLGQESKMVLVPGSYLFFILSQNFLDIFFNLEETYG